MIDVFERLAPAYGRILRKFSIDVWYDRADVNELLGKANHFRKRYVDDLRKYFERLGFRFSPKRLEELSNNWLADQIVTSRKIVTIADLKKGKIAADLSNLDAEKQKELRELLKGDLQPGKVAPVVSFADNLEAKAVQLGEQSAFELGRNLNHDTVKQNSDVYEWVTQGDSHVRRTHQKLANRLFSYNSPPTTIDKYGHRHTGNPGSDWGCRCYEVPSNGKPLLDFVAKE